MRRLIVTSCSVLLVPEQGPSHEHLRDSQQKSDTFA